MSIRAVAVQRSAFVAIRCSAELRRAAGNKCISAHCVQTPPLHAVQGPPFVAMSHLEQCSSRMVHVFLASFRHAFWAQPSHCVADVGEHITQLAIGDWATHISLGPMHGVIGVGDRVGDALGDADGLCEGLVEGDAVGFAEGLSVGTSVGEMLGCCVGNTVGDALGRLVVNDGDVVGLDEGELDGKDVMCAQFMARAPRSSTRRKRSNRSAMRVVIAVDALTGDAHFARICLRAAGAAM